MKELFDAMKDEARMHLSDLVGYNVMNSHMGVHDARADVYKRGDCAENATADALYIQWMWADCEERYHAMKPDAK